MGIKISMDLETIDMMYREAKDRKKQIDIIADMNETEPAYIALLLQRMGNDVHQHKMPRAPRTEGAADKRAEFEMSGYGVRADLFRERKYRTMGKIIAANTGKRKEEDDDMKSYAQEQLEHAKAKEAEGQAVSDDMDNQKTQTQRVDDALGTYGARERLAFLMWGMFLEEKYGKVPFNAEDLEVLGQLRGVAERVGGAR